jgi:predicted nucleic acid-binding protein
MSLVVDSSVTLAWVHEDEKNRGTDAVLDLVVDRGAIVPLLWHLEVANGLQVSIRRRRISERNRDTALAFLVSLDIEIDPDTMRRAWSDTLALSTRFTLTVYDAAYLELARRRSLPLASLDRELRAAAAALGVRVLPQQV